MTKPRRRSKIPPSERFFQMHNWLLNSAAWKAASVYERCLYMELKQRYNGSNNGEISFSHREAQAALNCSNKPVMAAFDGLITKGFIRAAQIGSFHWKSNGAAGGRATRWILTEYPVDYPVKSLSPERQFMSWKPGDVDNSRYAQGIRMVVREHTMKDVVVVPEHTMKSKVYAGGTR